MIRPARVRAGPGGDWYAEVAPAEYQALYEEVHRALLDDVTRPRPTACPRLSGSGSARPPRTGAPAASYAPSAFPASKTPLRSRPRRAATVNAEPRRRRSCARCRRVRSTSRPSSATPSATGSRQDGPARPAPPITAWPTGCRSSSVAAVAAGPRRAWRPGRGHALAAAPHGQRALLRARLVGHALPAPAHRHAVGLARALRPRRHLPRPNSRAASPGSAGTPWCAIARPPRWSSSRVTSRCAGATGASAGRPRRRATSTHHTTSSRGTSPCNERLRSRRASAPPLRVPVLHGRDVVLRPWSISDLSLVRQASADAFVPSISSIPRHYSDDTGRAFIERQHRRASRRRRDLVRDRRGGGSRAGDRFHGSVAPRDRERPGLGRLLAPRTLPGPPAWPRDALRTLVDFAFGGPGIPRLHLFVEPWNVASARTAEAAGFVREATLRGWERIDGEQRDADCFALLSGEWRTARER